MKKLLSLFVFLIVAPFVGAGAQTTTTMYRVDTIAALKAIPTSRPPIVIVMDAATGGPFEWGTSPCSAADDVYQVTPTAGPAGCWTRLANINSVGKSAIAYGVLTTNSTGVPSITPRSAFTSSISVDQYYSGSGTYDAAIAAAVAAAPSSGANLVFTPGTVYTVSAPIVVDRGNLKFQCAGLRTCNIQSTSTTADMFAVNLTVATTTISTTSGSTAATVASGSGITNGMQINSANVPAGTTVTISGTNITLSANATGTAAGTAATFGNMVYDVYWDGFVFSRASTSSAGCQISARNLAYTGVSNSRFYGNETSWKHVCLRSVNDFAMENVQSDNPQNAHLTLEGVSANGYGTLDGAFIGLTLRNYTYFIGGHAATASPLNHGSIEIGDFTGGLFFDTTLIARPRGYAIRMEGTSAGYAAGINSLVFLNNLNVEGSGPDGESGGIYAEYYSNINVTGGWISGKGVPALTQGANSAGVAVVGAELVINGSSAPIVSTAGSALNISGTRLQSYNPGVGLGVSLVTGAASINLQGNHFESLATGISDGGLSNIDINIDGNQFYNTTTPITSAIYGWAKATVGPSNSNENGPLAAKSLLVYGDATLSKSQNAANSFVCLNGSTGASAACRLFLQTGTANASVALAMNDSGGSPYAALSGGSATSMMYHLFPEHRFLSSAGAEFARFDNTGLTIEATKSFVFRGTTFSGVTGSTSLVGSASPTVTTPTLAGTQGVATLRGTTQTTLNFQRADTTQAYTFGRSIGNTDGQDFFLYDDVNGVSLQTWTNTLITFGVATTGTDITGTGTVRANTAFSANGATGLSATTTVRDAAGTGTCTLIFTFGIKTGGTC